MWETFFSCVIWDPQPDLNVKRSLEDLTTNMKVKRHIQNTYHDFSWKRHHMLVHGLLMLVIFFHVQVYPPVIRRGNSYKPPYIEKFPIFSPWFSYDFPYKAPYISRGFPSHVTRSRGGAEASLSNGDGLGTASHAIDFGSPEWTQTAGDLTQQIPKKCWTRVGSRIIQLKPYNISVFLFLGI